MTEPDTQRRGEEGGEKLYTLSEVSQKSGISMPTLQRYKKLYQNRIPAVGKGRKQRYPEGALAVFDEIKQENVGKRGRPRKNAAGAAAASGRRAAKGGTKAVGTKAAGTKTAGTKAAAGRKPGGRKAASQRTPPAETRGAGGRKKAAGKGEGLLTLTEISERTGISYPTLVRYVRLHSDRLPHEGKGRARRFYPQAVDAFRQLRQESGRGGRKKGTVAAKRAGGATRGRVGRPPAAREESGAFGKRLKAIEKSQQNIEKRFRALVKNLQGLFR